MVVLPDPEGPVRMSMPFRSKRIVSIRLIISCE